jgi:hypothetical protein
MKLARENPAEHRRRRKAAIQKAWDEALANKLEIEVPRRPRRTRRF